MTALVMCEESGIVTAALRSLGHNAKSCDLQPGRIPEHHLQMDCFDAFDVRTVGAAMVNGALIGGPKCQAMICAAGNTIAKKIGI